jgi:hypothetical protein
VNLTFSTDEHREPRHDGGVDMTISLTRHEAATLGADAATLTDRLTTALAALAALRTGHVGADPDAPAPTVDNLWYWVVNDLDNRLPFRLEGIRDAVIRRYFSATAPGSLSRLATAMDAPRSTAQSLRNKITSHEPTTWERWATGERVALPDQLDRAKSPVPARELAELDPDLVANVPPLPDEDDEDPRWPLPDDEAR